MGLWELQIVTFYFYLNIYTESQPFLELRVVVFHSFKLSVCVSDGES